MVVYEIPMKFKYAPSGFNYYGVQSELNHAMSRFNFRADKSGKGRTITDVRCEDNGFVIVMESWEKLVNPSKALAVFSQELALIESLAELKDTQNHLLANNGKAEEIKRVETIQNLTDCEIMKTVAEIVLGSNVSDNSRISKNRKETKKQIMEICLKFRSLHQEGC